MLLILTVVQTHRFEQEKVHFDHQTKSRPQEENASQQYEKILAYWETHTVQETDEWRGRTKQTYYRRIKELKKEAEQESQK